MSAGMRFFLPLLFGAATFLAAALFYWIQPLAAKMLYPRLGGTPAVWNTCLVFFQAAVLVGYVWAFLIDRVPGWIWKTALAAVLAGFAWYWIAAMLGSVITPSVANPNNAVWSTLVALTFSVGAPMLILAAMIPLFQLLFSRTGHPQASDPYFLSALGSVGGLAMLVLFPRFLEPEIGLRSQVTIWMLALPVFLVLAAACVTIGVVMMRRSSATADTPPTPEAGKTLGAPTVANRLLWIAATAIPVCLLMGLTAHFTLDLTPVPYLWLAPLVLYFFTWIMAFARFSFWDRLPFLARLVVQIGYGCVLFLVLTVIIINGMSNSGSAAVAVFSGLLVVMLVAAPLNWMLVLQPLSAVAVLFNMAGAVDLGLGTAIVHFLAFGCAARTCHGVLAQTRPATPYLTAYYATVGLGGLLGGLFNTLLAPTLFASAFLEYPLAIALACALRPPYMQNGLLDWLLSLIIESAQGRRSKESPLHRVLLAYGFDLLFAAILVLPLIAIFAGQESLRKLIKTDPIRSRFLYDLVVTGLALLVCLIVVARPLRFALALVALVLVSWAYQESARTNQTVLVVRRTPFGILRVFAEDELDPRQMGRKEPLRFLMHGTTYHGRNYLATPELRRLATTYYHSLGPMGTAMAPFERFQDFRGQTYSGDVALPAGLVAQIAEAPLSGFLPLGALARTQTEPPIAVLGLGVGTMASYARPFQRMDFFEIDPEVIRLCDAPAPEANQFHFIEDARKRGAEVNVFIGDARLGLARHGPSGYYKRIVVDAFSSDAIPYHLLTHEAIDLYLSKLAPDGVICFHTSNRWLDLPPVLHSLAAERKLAFIVGHDMAQDRDRGGDASWRGHFGSQWAFIAPNPRLLPHQVPLRLPEHIRFGPNIEWTTPRPIFAPAWTDDYSSLIPHLRPGVDTFFRFLAALLLSALALAVIMPLVEMLSWLIPPSPPLAELDEPPPAAWPDDAERRPRRRDFDAPPTYRERGSQQIRRGDMPK